MSKRAVDTVFQALFLLTDLRVLLRQTAPLHELSDIQKGEAADIIDRLEHQVAILREELVQ